MWWASTEKEKTEESFSILVIKIRDAEMKVYSTNPAKYKTI